jgi:acetyl-CoA carboxylase biotin carboxylase subunit
VFGKVLIANRGEIAKRVATTCKKMGIKTVAIYSEADKESPYLDIVDEAYLIGPPPPRASYLLENKIMEVALDCKADAVHPGYGFLSENQNFARACKNNGLVFIGPKPEIIQAMGKKIEARATMAANGIPVIQGSDAIENAKQAMTAAVKIGYPVLLKASGGGGGIGMEIVSTPEQIEASFEKCRSRAKAAFGDETVYIEKYLASPRHIEIQVVADQHGNVWHLGERDCSVQRRHQKVIEESPSPAVPDNLRAKMCDDAVKAALAIQYDSVGTVEMLMDENKNFYFLEMNTRIQVEHGITELRTGTDLVELQMLAAAGEPLPDANRNASGHSLECRIYAENPLTFYPSCGTIEELNFPSGDGIRIDHSIEKGYIVTPFYDPLLAKVMVWSENREACIKKMWSVLDSTIVSGISTNIPFLMSVLEDEEFNNHGATTLLTEKILLKMKNSNQLAKAV